MDKTGNYPVIKENFCITAAGQDSSLIRRGLGLIDEMPVLSEDEMDAARQWELGCEYINGISSQRDYEQAFYWFSNAAEKGHAEAQFALGAMYDAGEGVEKNDVLAISWYEKAAMQGHAWAKRNLALRGIAVDEISSCRAD